MRVVRLSVQVWWSSFSSIRMEGSWSRCCRSVTLEWHTDVCCRLQFVLSVGEPLIVLYIPVECHCKTAAALPCVLVLGNYLCSVPYRVTWMNGTGHSQSTFNPLNPELNPICYLLALLGAHHFLHVSRIRVKLLTFRRLIYIYIYMEHLFLMFLDHTQRRSIVGRTPLDE